MRRWLDLCNDPAMINGKPTIIFDTSALNALADEADSLTILKGIGTGFAIRLSETNLAEVVGTKKTERREQLLAACQQLVSSGQCIRPFYWIVEQLSRQHARDSLNFDWRRIDLRFSECDDELARRAFLNDPDLSDEQRKYAHTDKQEFETIYRNARPAFERIFEKAGAERPSISDFIRALKVEGGAFWAQGISIYERPTGKALDETGIQAFVNICPPFHALLLCLMIAEFHRCVKDPNAESLFKAGKLDLMMSVYLPYCDQFVTNDSGQYNCLLEVASEAGLAVRVRKYCEFRAGLLVGSR